MHKLNVDYDFDNFFNNKLDCNNSAFNRTRIWPLKIYTLTRFNLVRNNLQIQFNRKVKQKPLVMLKALITLGGRNVKTVTIMDLLWPDCECDISHQSFKITLHRLRRLLGPEQPILLQNGCLSMDPRCCWVDIWAFERLVSRIDALQSSQESSSDPKEITSLTCKALSLYSGDFLAADNDLAWTFSTRERLRSKFIRLVINSGYYWEKTEAWHKAAECYQKGLEIDDMVEEFYQRLLVCYYHLGKRGEALALFNRCHTTLAMQCLKPTIKTRTAFEATIKEYV